MGIGKKHSKKIRHENAFQMASNMHFLNLTVNFLI